MPFFVFVFRCLDATNGLTGAMLRPAMEDTKVAGKSSPPGGRALARCGLVVVVFVLGGGVGGCRAFAEFGVTDSAAGAGDPTAEGEADDGKY